MTANRSWKNRIPQVTVLAIPLATILTKFALCEELFRRNGLWDKEKLAQELRSVVCLDVRKREWWGLSRNRCLYIHFLPPYFLPISRHIPPTTNLPIAGHKSTTQTSHSDTLTNHPRRHTSITSKWRKKK